MELRLMQGLGLKALTRRHNSPEYYIDPSDDPIVARGEWYYTSLVRSNAWQAPSSSKTALASL